MEKVTWPRKTKKVIAKTYYNFFFNLKLCFFWKQNESVKTETSFSSFPKIKNNNKNWFDMNKIACFMSQKTIFAVRKVPGKIPLYSELLHYTRLQFNNIFHHLNFHFLADLRSGNFYYVPVSFRATFLFSISRLTKKTRKGHFVCF